jgi:hypothetical protein
MPDYDLPAKRSACLAHARENGWDRIGLLDDDIRLSDRQVLCARTALSEGAEMATFHVLCYPDVSTIDHVERLLTRQPSRVSPGGNCLFLRASACVAPFPRIYNDDSLFLMRHRGAATIVSIGAAAQRPHRPWEDTRRVRFEQFGDILIEGIKLSLESRGAMPVGPSYWESYLARYRSRLDGLLRRAPSGVLSHAVVAARHAASAFTATALASFIDSYFETQRGS